MSGAPPALTDAEVATLEGLLARLSGRGTSLPWPLFRFINEVTATPNVDLLVLDRAQGRDRVLLAWRDDPFGTGWHVPGSIIRHREEIGHRLDETAQDEFGCAVDTSAGPVALVQIFDDRGHSVSLCHLATLRGEPGRRVIGPQDAPEAGDLCWFETMPERIYPSHLVYRSVIEALRTGEAGAIPVFTQHVGARDAALDDRAGGIGSDRGLD